MAADSKLTALMAASATGYGVVIDDILNIRTVTDTPNGAALNGLYVGGFQIMSNCGDPDCDCKVRLIAKLMPTAKVVAVKVEVI